VRHDHVVAIHSVDEVKGLPYLVMEYVHGTSLQARLERTGALEVREVLRIGMQTAAGLEAAHAQGLVHRDVKPSNILLENGVERVKLSDFGLARAVDDASLTQSGVIAGTPQYMSPEQANGQSIDHRSDLFSLGSTLYAMCTGRAPFRAPSTAAVLRRVCEDAPRPVREVNPEVPEWLEQIIARLQAKSPEDRYQSAGEVAAVLGRCLADRQGPGPKAVRARAPVEARRLQRLAVALAVSGVVLVLLLPCLLLGLGVALAWSLLTSVPDGAPPEPPQEVPPPALVAPPPVAAPARAMPIRPAPRAELANAKIRRDGDGTLHFSVDYELRGVGPDLTLSYRWVVCSGERILYERTTKGRDMAVEGTLSGERPTPRIPVAAPLETYLECKRLIPGKLGWQVERISKVVKLAE
jgi:serine/threonine-protein kinase